MGGFRAVIRRAIRAVGRALFWVYRFFSRLFFATVVVVLFLAARLPVLRLRERREAASRPT